MNGSEQLNDEGSLEVAQKWIKAKDRRRVTERAVKESENDEEETDALLINMNCAIKLELKNLGDKLCKYSRTNLLCTMIGNTIINNSFWNHFKYFDKKKCGIIKSLSDAFNQTLKNLVGRYIDINLYKTRYFHQTC